MTRRWSFAVVIAVAYVGCLGCSRPMEAPNPGSKEDFHVVLLGIDTLRADYLSVYGFSHPTSPRIDQLASEGALFTDAVTTSPWTLPSFASVLSGQYPSSHGAGRRTGEQREGGEPPKSPLPGTVALIPEMLRDRAGFETALFYDNPYLSETWGLTRGFDTVQRTREGGAQAVDLALDWLEDHSEDRTFVFLHLMEPHLPYKPPEPFRTTALEWLGSDPRRPGARALYVGEVTYVDHLVGTFLDGLEAVGLADETLLILTSDHGEEFGEHAEIEERLYNDPRKIWGIGHGHSQFQELIAAPLIIRFPGRVQAGTKVDSLVQIHDLAPTILEWTDLPVPEGMSGQSLLPALSGEPVRDYAFTEFILYGDDRQSYREGSWKLILGPGFETSELYDLASDPGETRNLRDEQPRRFRELLVRLRELRAQAAILGELQGRGTDPVEIDQATREELRSLGYIQ